MTAQRTEDHETPILAWTVSTPAERNFTFREPPSFHLSLHSENSENRISSGVLRYPPDESTEEGAGAPVPEPPRTLLWTFDTIAAFLSTRSAKFLLDRAE